MFRRSLAAATRATSRRAMPKSSFSPSFPAGLVARSAAPAIAVNFGNSMKFFSTDASAPVTQKFEFQAETRKLLDIVTHSIYTDKEVFLRELVSNASDSLEKFRYLKTTGAITATDNDPLEINISVDAKKKTLTIIDNGIGMSKEDLISNLGTIARSGSKQFVERIKESSVESAKRDGDGIIGQFGVGFYSAFMVADTVSVESLSAEAASTSNIGATWTSGGTGDFTIQQSEGVTRGSKVELQLKEACKEYADVKKIKEIIKKYSNFVPFPIKVDGEVVNTVSAIWVQDKASVKEEQYTEFYKFISNAFDKPSFHLHFKTDAPINLNALLFIPTFHTEKFGQGRMESGVNLYSRKVLIESKPKDLLPDWLRFIKGVVDSEDLPLSISREKPQDSLLLKKIRDVLTRKLIRFLEDKSKNEPEKYKEFYIEFNYFLKEGICQDFAFQQQLAKLLRFESSNLGEGELTSFDEYASRCKPEQKKIYYLVAPNRAAALNSPYYETFKNNNVEVLFLYSAIDDFVMSNVRTVGDKSLTSAEASSLDLPSENKAPEAEDAKKDESSKDSTEALSEADSNALCAWLKLALGNRVKEVKVTNRLSGSPAIVTDHESGSMRRMMRMVEQANNGKIGELPPQTLEVNPKHPIIRGLFSAFNDDSKKLVAELIAAQMLDNALIAAGIMDDARGMIPRLNDILAAAITK